MNARTRTGIEIVTSAMVVGVFGNLMLRQTPWGLNAFLFVAVFTVAMVILTKRHRPELLTWRTLALQAAMVFFGAMFLFRSAEELLVFDTIAILVMMGVLVLSNFGVNQRVAGVFHYIAGLVWSGITSAFGAVAVLGADIDWREMPGNRISKTVFSVLRGVAIALPLVVVFGALFMAADAAFEGMINRMINFEIDVVISHVMITSGLAWLTAGYFRGLMIENFAAAAASSPIPKADEQKADSPAEAAEGDGSRVDRFVAEQGAESAEQGPLPNNATVLEHINRSEEPAETPETKSEVGKSEASNDHSAEGPGITLPRKRDWQNWDNKVFPSVFTLGTVETVIVLGLLDVLFLSFVIFQLPYLFGGMEFVQNTPDLKLADFARRGFGELVAVSFLVLPILLASHWLLRRDNVRNEIIFRVLAGIQIGLLFVIMTSAMQRLVLLTGELGYGWTTVRFYPMVAMIWLAIVFIWFGWTVLRGRRNYFAWGALWSAIIVLGATNLMDPNAFIARSNLQLMQQGRPFDGSYNARLSDDAVPTLLSGLSEMPLDEQCAVKSALRYRYAQFGNDIGIRSFNFARQAALTELQANETLLQQTEGCPPRFQIQFLPGAE
jgi:hypothetical protein